MTGNTPISQIVGLEAAHVHPAHDVANAELVLHPSDLARDRVRVAEEHQLQLMLKEREALLK